MIYTKPAPSDFQNELANAVVDDANVDTNIQNQIALKASITYVHGQLLLQANQRTTYTKTEVDTALYVKAHQSTTYAYTETDTALGIIANQLTTYTEAELYGTVSPRSDKIFVDGHLALKPNHSTTILSDFGDTVPYN
ncbi:MAG: hypothetical protein ACKPKO_15775 [Candidatus Fonsibacter sp.]